MPDVSHSTGEQLPTYGLPASSLSEPERYYEEHALYN